MGRAKIDLPFAGSTFLDRVVSAARGTFDEVVAVQRNGASAIDSLRTIFEEPHESEGPVFGVLRALREQSGKLFVLALDYPLLTTGILTELRRRFEQSSAPMLVPMWRGRPQMLCAGYASSLESNFARRVATGRFDLRGLIEEAGAEMIAESDLRPRFAGEPLMNVNTPEELEEARRIDGQ
jgi:molybdopterin-guanine dinucleotide biosynthesis protein A